MSIFGSIKDAIFGHPAAAEAKPAPTPTPAAAPAPAAAAPAPAPAAPKTIDADAALEKIYHSKGEPDLNYKSSIVDLMKLIGMDPSLDNRKTLATELGYEGEKDGSAEMNIWLHKRVMERIRTGQ
jgi:3-oxoacyl-ACP reductase-like protein